MVLVSVAGGLRGAFGLEVGINGWRELAQAINMSRRHTFVKGHQFVVLDPVEFVGVDLRRRRALALHSLKCLGQGLHLLRDTEDEFVVAHIDRAADELAALGVGTGNDQVLAAHHVPLESCGCQSVDVFSHRNKHLASKVTALLSSVELILEMHCRGAILSEKLGEFENSRQAAVPGGWSVKFQLDLS